MNLIEVEMQILIKDIKTKDVSLLLQEIDNTVGELCEEFEIITDQSNRLETQVMQKIAEELLSCPFCGETPKISKEKSLVNNTEMWQVKCEGYKCEIAPSTDLYKNKKECIVDWNKRA